MSKAKLLNSPADFERIGVKPDQIEVWEDGRRNLDTGKGNWEWWYFDAIMDDGTKVVIQFFTKAGMRKIEKDGDAPSLTFKVTLPDGSEYKKDVSRGVFKPSQCSFATDKCDVRLGKNVFEGNLDTYHIKVVKDKKGYGADLTLKSMAKPYRPGTGYFGFEGDEFYTWFCAVPRGEVTGTLTIKGKKVKVHGYGYHDHQWGNQFFLPEWNHWVWARQSFEDYSVLVFDFVTSEKFGFERIPIIFIQDNDGNLVFQSNDNVKCKILREHHDKEASGKDYPIAIDYEFTDGKQKVHYILDGNQILEAQGLLNVPFLLRKVIEKTGIDIAYSRFGATGTLELDTGKDVIKRSGEMIFEFMYPGATFKGHM